MLPRPLVSVLSTLLLCGLARVAAAEEPSPVEQFERGRALMLEGRYDEACPLLAKSQERDPHVGTLLNLAACHEKQGRVGSAWVEYQKALTAAKAEGQQARARLAEERIAALDARVPWLTVVAPEASGAEVLLDGAALAPPALGKELPVDPGAHTVSARAEDGARAAEDVTLAEGEHRTVRLVLVASPAPTGQPQPLPAPERIVVEPKPTATPALSPEKPKLGRFVFEAGLFVGFVSLEATNPVIQSSTARVVDPTQTGATPRACARETCSARLDSLGGGTAGVLAYVGYAVTESVSVGVRGLVGPRLSTGGGYVFGVGPSVSVAMTEGLRVGLWGMLGDASASPAVSATPLAPYRLETAGETRVRSNLSGGFGIGFEASYVVASVGRGSIALVATPFFVPASNGSFWAVPAGAVYRFR